MFVFSTFQPEETQMRCIPLTTHWPDRIKLTLTYNLSNKRLIVWLSSETEAIIFLYSRGSVCWSYVLWFILALVKWLNYSNLISTETAQQWFNYNGWRITKLQIHFFRQKWTEYKNSREVDRDSVRFLIKIKNTPIVQHLPANKSVITIRINMVYGRPTSQFDIHISIQQEVLGF